MEYIAAALEGRGHRVQLRDLRFSDRSNRFCGAFDLTLVGIACMHALEIDDVRDVVARVRATAPDTTIYRVGGHSAAAYPSPFFDAGVDAICLDDGERAVPALVDGTRRGHAAGGRARAGLLRHGPLAADAEARHGLSTRRRAAAGTASGGRLAAAGTRACIIARRT